MIDRHSLPWVLFAASVLALFAVLQMEPAPDSGLWERAANLAAAERDSIALVNAGLLAAADSAALVSARADSLAREQIAKATERAATYRRQASASRDSLAARLDSQEVSMLERYDADRDAIDAAEAEVVDAIRSQLLTTTAERDALLLAVTGLRAEVAALTRENDGLREAIDSLHDRIRGAERQGLITKGVLAVGAVAVLVDKVAL